MDCCLRLNSLAVHTIQSYEDWLKKIKVIVKYDLLDINYVWRAFNWVAIRCHCFVEVCWGFVEVLLRFCRGFVEVCWGFVEVLLRFCWGLVEALLRFCWGFIEVFVVEIKVEVLLLVRTRLGSLYTAYLGLKTQKYFYFEKNPSLQNNQIVCRKALSLPSWTFK